MFLTTSGNWKTPYVCGLKEQTIYTKFCKTMPAPTDCCPRFPAGSADFKTQLPFTIYAEVRFPTRERSLLSSKLSYQHFDSTNILFSMYGISLSSSKMANDWIWSLISTLWRNYGWRDVRLALPYAFRAKHDIWRGDDEKIFNLASQKRCNMDFKWE